MVYKTDILIVGSGVAGLYCALKLPTDKKVTIITKADPEECDSWLAQGGICVLRNEQDYDAYYEDTLRAGHYENDRSSVDIMIRSSQQSIEDLVSYGVDFERDENGELLFTREGAHSVPRILFHEDVTGREITSTLLEAVKKLSNVTIYNHTTMIDIITSEGRCQGIVALAEKDSALAAASSGGVSDENPDGIPLSNDGRVILKMEAKEVVWACGGIGGLFEHSTNFPHMTGDALGIAIKHGIRLRDPDYVQIHPTTLYSEKPGRSFLISESVRGEGGILLNDKGERFVDELLPRDTVSKAIYDEMEKTDAKHVWLSMEKIPEDTILHHFKNIYETCLKEGYDCRKEPIPVVPAQHYFMGGVDVNSDSRTSMPQLYAIGETSCNGVHGANRLASNSLLESLVFAQRAAQRIAGEIDEKTIDESAVEELDLSAYKDTDALFAGYKENILKEISGKTED
jgi:L-aspartate oxidase